MRTVSRTSLLLVPLVTSCYRYVPVANPAPEVGAEVRVRLTEAGSAQLTPILGRGTAAVLGRIVEVTDTAYALSVSGTQKAPDGGDVVWAGERVVVPRSAIAGEERRTLNKGRTIGLAAIGAAVAVGLGFAIKAIGSAISGNDTPGPVGTPP